MKYLKAYLSASYRGLKFFAVLYIVLAALSGHGPAFLFLYYAASVGIAGLLSEVIDTAERKRT